MLASPTHRKYNISNFCLPISFTFIFFFLDISRLFFFLLQNIRVTCDEQLAKSNFFLELVIGAIEFCPTMTFPVDLVLRIKTQSFLLFSPVGDLHASVASLFGANTSPEIREDTAFFFLFSSLFFFFRPKTACLHGLMSDTVDFGLEPRGKQFHVSGYPP